MIPVWLFDELADRRRSVRDLEAKLEAWSDLLDGGVEVDRLDLPADTLTFPALPGCCELCAAAGGAAVAVSDHRHEALCGRHWWRFARAASKGRR